MSDLQRLDIERQVQRARQSRNEALGELLTAAARALRRGAALAAIRLLRSLRHEPAGR